MKIGNSRAFAALAALITLSSLLAACEGDLLSTPRAAKAFAAAIKTASEPTFSPSEGSYSAGQSVSIASATPDASIFYSIATDGSIPPDPSASSTRYATPIAVAGTGTKTTIKAIAIKAGFVDSIVAEAAYTIVDPQATAAPTFTPSAGIYGSDQVVAISSPTPGATIRYTIAFGGNVPTAPNFSSTIYTGPIQVAGNGTKATIKAIAVKDGLDDSSVATADYSIDYSQAATPVLSLASDQSLSIVCVTAGVAIHYNITTDGNDPAEPTSASTTYSDPISIAGDGSVYKIKAIATAPGMKNSNVVSATYTIAHPGSISVSVSLNPLSATPIAFSSSGTPLGTSPQVQKGSSLPVSFDTTSFDTASFAWYLDFSGVPSSTASSYAIATGNLGYGAHTVVLIVTKNGISYSGSFNFVVTR